VPLLIEGKYLAPVSLLGVFSSDQAADKAVSHQKPRNVGPREAPLKRTNPTRTVAEVAGHFMFSPRRSQTGVCTMTVGTIIAVAPVVVATTGLCALLVVWLAD
jgi:hypothetical protein